MCRQLWNRAQDRLCPGLERSSLGTVAATRRLWGEVTCIMSRATPQLWANPKREMLWPGRSFIKWITTLQCDTVSSRAFVFSVITWLSSQRNCRVSWEGLLGKSNRLKGNCIDSKPRTEFFLFFFILFFIYLTNHPKLLLGKQCIQSFLFHKGNLWLSPWKPSSVRCWASSALPPPKIQWESGFAQRAQVHYRTNFNN